MIKKALLISLPIVIAAVAAVGTRSVFSQPPKAEEDQSIDRWEYLVVQGGNVNLSAGDGGGSMRKADGAFSREAFPLEKNMDKLGAKGWELVSVTGTSGDPVFYFKRRK